MIAGARLDDDAAGREVRALDEVEELLVGGARVLDQMQAGVAELVDVVRRDVGRHADGDAGRAVGEQVREGGGQHHRLLLGAVVVVAEVDGVLGEALHQRRGGGGEAGLGVALGGGVVAVDVAEVALAVDQRVADVEVLREPGQRLVDRAVAVRVVVAHHLADDLGALAEGAVRVEAQAAHRVEDAAVHRLQAVAGVRQRPVHDGGERVGQVALAERAGQRLGGDATHLAVVGSVGHRCCDTRGGRRLSSAFSGRVVRRAGCRRWPW